jgi:superfamily I DNA/RNA helicase
MANLDDRYDIDNRTAAFEQHERGLLVCLAGPGTGKTFSLLARVAALTGRGCDPDSICYLTFIKEISKAFIDDYIEHFGQESFDAGAPRISTLHSFACRLLRNQGFRLGCDGELYFASVAEVDDAGETFMGDLLPIVTRDGCRTVPQLRGQLNVIKKGWRDHVDPATLPEPAPDILRLSLVLSRSFRLVDWDETIPLARAILEDLPETPEWIQKIRHFFVDEYQDFNCAEQGMIRILEKASDSMVIVGDDDQSLYSGRGGAPDGIRDLYAGPECDHVSLVKCYRCPSNIVLSVNRFQATMSADPRPMSAVNAGGQVLCYRFKSSKAECAYLVEYLNARIAELAEAPGPKDGIVCLFPTKRVLNCYFEMLSPSIACVKRGAIVSARRHWLERVLQLLIRPHQRFIERLLLNRYQHIKPRHRRLIIDCIIEQDVSPSAACESLLSEGCFTAKALAEATAFVAMCEAIASRDLAQVASTVAGTLSVQEGLALEQLHTLTSADQQLRADLVEVVCDTLLPDTAAQPDDARAVLFLTIHGSKGLTKNTVVLPGLEDACLPGGANTEDLPERQRLFFVALSRASKNLLLTFPHNRGGNDSLKFDMPGRGVASPFIASAGLVASYHA